MKRAGFLLVLSAVAAAAPFEHGHKLGTSVAYLDDSGDVRDGNPLSIRLTDRIAGSIVIQAAGAIQSAGAVAVRPGAIPNSGLSKPCVVFETWAEQQNSDYMESAQTGVTAVQRTAGKAVFYRFVRDDLRKIYASYSVTVEKLPEEGTYRVSFGPPPDGYPTQIDARVYTKDGWQALRPAKYPAPQIMKAEDSIGLELYSNGGLRRVVDYIHAGRQDRMVMRKETPRVYYADDAELAVTKPRFWVNGVAENAVSELPETIRGPVLWVYIPGHGQFFLSLRSQPDLGFETAGEAAGNSLTFTSPDGNVFRIDTTERVAAGSGSYSVEVRPDPGWTPADPQDRGQVTIGASLGVVASPGVEGR